MLMRGAVGLQLREPARFDAYVRAMFRSHLGRREKPERPGHHGRRAACRRALTPALLALTQDAEVKDRLKAVTQEAVDRGVFGAPTFFVGDPDVLGPGPHSILSRKLLQ
jgi:2-hydroxychromene-2-carboxylate isomerase